MRVERARAEQRRELMHMLVFGVLPLGTGNDFSRTFNWGGHPPKDLTESNTGLFGFPGGLTEEEVTRTSLEKSVRLWIAASVTCHDLWTVDLHTCPGGDFFFVVESADVLASTSAAMQS
eukprot:CAMPEP_0179449516 /NCGR_PEP_ID=MMETSP0799-20121207/33452_1 /TAXON_ID=46947 /ORGANISM="Geminigera cryophila, Strain CCMP2564" /LENGTH=118 /DNA_ID=CAMNT_0021242617 /DNA_START=101 /DNA_END=454 /DNA_ORIENTATION=-